MVDIARKISGQVSNFVLVAEIWNTGSDGGRFVALRETCSLGSKLWNEHPYEVVALFAVEASGIDPINLQRLIGGERRNQAALSRVRGEFPAMITAFHLLTIKRSARKRHAAVRAGIAQREGAALGIASHDQWNFEQHGWNEMSALDLFAGERPIPKTEQHNRVGRLAVEGGIAHVLWR